MKQTSKLTGIHWFTALIMGMVYTSFGNLQYLVRDYYVMYQEANALADSQMGAILTAVGICATIAYAYNGILTDLVKPKILMSITIGLAVVAGVILFMNPGYLFSMLIFCMFALLPLWGPMSKLVVGISDDEQVSKMFGWLDFFVAVFGVAAGMIASRIVAASGSVAAIRGLVGFYTACNVVALISVWVIDKKADQSKLVASEKGEDAFSFRKVGTLLADPNQWLQWLGVALGYTGWLAMTYVGPMLSDVFGMDTATVTAIDAVKNNGIGLIAPLISGWLAAKYGAVRSYFLWLALYIVSAVMLVFLPWASGLAWLIVLAGILVATSVKGRSAISNTVITDCKTPLALFGTSVCVQSIFMSIPDMFIYTWAGNWLDQHGNGGYKYIFGLCLFFSVAGLVCNIILDRRLKAGKTSEWFFAQKKK